ncbi:hypothetical protein OTU49_004838 [Cherax quadricarinatus]|uniref:Uncharacterized protein n=1 Tax=Cherax quadricarinatus TaxID=27406 RepID=A0AAW0X8N4_CHEQU
MMVPRRQTLNNSQSESQNYDNYEYDPFDDRSAPGVDQDFGGSSAQVAFAVPVTEYLLEETTTPAIEIIEEEVTSQDPDDTTEEALSTVPVSEVVAEDLVDEATTEGTTTDPLLLEEVTELVSEPPPQYEDTTELGALDEYLVLTTQDPITTLTSVHTTVPTPFTLFNTTTVTAASITTTTTRPRPASIRPLYARLQSISKKTLGSSDKKLSRTGPKILGESTITEIRSSDPVICFRGYQRCVKANGLRKRRAALP